jgi:phage baseplate assembly protein W|tara:strand:- start:1331 stop:1732 length:402 start_codon:yes stop_codon:yes gene_type:complete
MPTKISRGFKDISLSFTRHPVTNDITVLKNEDAIKKSVMNLCRTSINERFFNPLIGTRIGQSLFEINDPDIAEFLEQDIENTLNNYEPRIKVKSVNSESILDSNELNIKVEYDIVGLPLPLQNIEFLLQPSKL